MTLAAIASISYLGGVSVRSSALLDAGFVVALVALAFERVRTEAFLANVASYGWAVLAGALVLDSLASVPLGPNPGIDAYLAVAAAGIVMLTVNFLIMRTILAVVRDGERLGGVLRQELLAHAPVTLAMVALGAVTVFGYQRSGLLALGVFAVIVTVPQLLLPLLARPRPVGDLEHTAAVRLYGDAIGRALGLSRKELAIVRDASTFMRERQLMPRTGELGDMSDAHRLGIVEAVLFHREHWDSPDGKPGSVGGEMIPLSSRILAVADAWAGLTAKHSPGLSHAQVLNQLEERAGMHFDPQIVEAARSVVAEQRLGGLGAVAYQPRLGRISTASAAYRLMAPQPEPAPQRS